MSLAQLLPYIEALSRRDKFFLVHKLIAELAQEEELAQSEYAVWSPHDAHEAAATLMQMLSQEKLKAAG